MTGYKVLLVEDDQIWVDILGRRMRLVLHNLEHSDDPVTIINNFEEAYKTLKEQSWDLLVTDIGLGDPRESLKKKGKHLLSLALEMGVPSVVVSGTSGLTRQDVWDFRERYHVSWFFDKLDFDEEKFIEKVEELLRIQCCKNRQFYDSDPTENKILSEGASTDKKQNVYALLIGIAKYRYLNTLSKTTNDARDLYSTFIKNGCPQQNLTLLLDEDATKVAISRELDQLAHRAKPDDTLVILFSGHGAQMIGGFSPGEYLCPVEAEINRIRDTCISDAEFTAALRSINVGRLAVFLDACHSGGVGEPKDISVQVKAGLSETTYNHFATGNGRVIIASCKPDEVSWELPGMQNGLFTHYLLEGLRGKAARKDGTVWITNLFGYLSENVPKHKPQHPFQKSATEDFVLSMIQ
jgi:Caspase domain